MDDQRPFAADGDDGETEAVNAPHRGQPRPTGSRAQPTAWLIGIGVVLALFLGLLVAWGLGMFDAA